MSPANDKYSQKVYSTDGGRVSPPAARPPAPDRGEGIVRVARTRSGRKGKTVTLVTGVPASEARAVATELKRLCGAGGSVTAEGIEIQGDHREAVAARLRGRYRVKLAGG